MVEYCRYKVVIMLMIVVVVMDVLVLCVLVWVGLFVDFIENEGCGVDVDMWFELVIVIVDEINDFDVFLFIGCKLVKGLF